MVTVASTIKGENTSGGNHQGHAFCKLPIKPKAPARKPMGIEPASPMKTRAGAKLKKRKLRAAPDTTMLENAMLLAPLALAAIAYPIKPIAVMPPDTPSAPSMKLYRFITHMSAKISNPHPKMFPNAWELKVGCHIARTL